MRLRHSARPGGVTSPAERAAGGGFGHGRAMPRAEKFARPAGNV